MSATTSERPARRETALVRQEFLDGHRDRGVVREDIVAGRIPDQEDVDPGAAEDLGGELVVGGQHGDGLTRLLHLLQMVHPDALRIDR